MHSGGCWSSVVATARERAALRLTPHHDWLIACVLPAGHDGAHGSDGAQGHAGRRAWLLWGDYARGAQNLADEFACPAQALDGAPCLFFGGHGGPHRYAAPVGQDFPQPAPDSQAGATGSGRQGMASPLPASFQPPRAAATPQSAPNPTSAPNQTSAPNPTSAPAALSHRTPEPRTAEPAPEPMPRSTLHGPPPLEPEDRSRTLSALDELFAGMPSLKDLPHTDLLAFPEGSFRSVPPSWPDSRGAYVAQHHLDAPIEPEIVVSGPDQFVPADPMPADPTPAIAPPSRGRRRRKDQASTDQAGHDRAGDDQGDKPKSGRRRSGAATVEQAPSSESRWLEVRPGAEAVLTTPMVRVISSNGDPVRMGVPTARRPLPGQVDIVSITAVVEDAAAQLRTLPEAREDGAVSAALLDVAQSLGRLAEVLRPR